MYVLTKSYNEYNQEGDYFVALLKNNNFNTVKSILPFLPDEEIQHIVNGGGRQDVEDEWYNMFKADYNTNYHDIGHVY